MTSMILKVQAIQDPSVLETLDQINKIIDSADLENGPWIAGGAPRKIYENLDFRKGDIDIFCSSKLQMEKLNKRLAAFKLVYESRDAFTYKVGDLTIQLIQRKFYPNLESVFKCFDFTICQFAIVGYSMFYTPQAAESSKTKTLMFNDFSKIGRSSLMGRLAKYAHYGFLLSNKNMIAALKSVVSDSITINLTTFPITNQCEVYDATTKSDNIAFKDVGQDWYLDNLLKSIGCENGLSEDALALINRNRVLSKLSNKTVMTDMGSTKLLFVNGVALTLAGVHELLYAKTMGGLPALSLRNVSELKKHIALFMGPNENVKEEVVQEVYGTICEVLNNLPDFEKFSLVDSAERVEAWFAGITNQASTVSDMELAVG